MRESIEKLLASIIPTDSESVTLGRESIQSIVGNEVNLDSEECAKEFSGLSNEGVIRVVGQPLQYIEVVDRRRVGPQRLLRGFCARHYGQVSPLIDKKFTQAILRRYGADHQLESPKVQAELDSLQQEGLIRIIGRDDAYIKMLGSN